MNKRKLFFTAVRISGALNYIMDIFASIGMPITEKSFNGVFYAIYNDVSDIAMDCLDFDNVTSSNIALDLILNVDKDVVEELCEKLWEEFGVKDDGTAEEQSRSLY